MSEKRVWVLEQGLVDGKSWVILNFTREGCMASLYAYVAEQWREGGMGNEKVPGEGDFAIFRYYEAHDGLEWWRLSPRKVIFPNFEEVDIEFAANQVEIVIAALVYAPYRDVEEDCGLTKGEGERGIESASQKLES